MKRDDAAPADYLTAAGAARLAATIASFWRERTGPGRMPVTCRVELQSLGNGTKVGERRGWQVPGVRSNLLAGLPPPIAR